MLPTGRKRWKIIGDVGEGRNAFVASPYNPSLFYNHEVVSFARGRNAVGIQAGEQGAFVLCHGIQLVVLKLREARLGQPIGRFLTFWRPYTRFSLCFYEADAYVRLKQADKAQDVLTQADATLRALKSQINDKDDFRKAYGRWSSAGSR